MLTKRVALYARVSTRDQNPAMQLDGLRQVAEQRGWQVQGEYVDHGVSGAQTERPQLSTLNEAVQRGEVDVVCVWRFDRFARSVKHLVEALEDYRTRAIDFVSVNDGIDTTTPAGRFSFHVIAAVAELERDILKERVMAGMEAARRRGERVGRPKAQLDIARASAMREAGKSYRQIAKSLGCGVATVHRALKEAVPKGSPGTSPQVNEIVA